MKFVAFLHTTHVKTEKIVKKCSAFVGKERGH
jgi:hypothetical protein